MKKSYIIAPFLVILLLLCGCAAKVTTTTATPTTNAPTTTAPSSTSTTAATISTASTVFTAQLSGAQVVPPIDTPAAGSVTFTVDPTGTRVHFVLKVSNITDAVAARLHEGQPGANGQGVVILFPGPVQSGTFTGALAEGNFNASSLVGSLTGKTIADFMALLQSGQAYVNVGTAKYPKGEIRGQIR